jgi:hypothetical protein
MMIDSDTPWIASFFAYSAASNWGHQEKCSREM